MGSTPPARVCVFLFNDAGPKMTTRNVWYCSSGLAQAYLLLTEARIFINHNSFVSGSLSTGSTAPTVFHAVRTEETGRSEQVIVTVEFLPY